MFRTAQLLAEENVPDPYDEIVIGSRQLADAGNKAAKNEDYLGAIGKYSEAIEIYPFDHRYVDPPIHLHVRVGGDCHNYLC